MNGVVGSPGGVTIPNSPRPKEINPNPMYIYLIIVYYLYFPVFGLSKGIKKE